MRNALAFVTALAAAGAPAHAQSPGPSPTPSPAPLPEPSRDEAIFGSSPVDPEAPATTAAPPPTTSVPPAPTEPNGAASRDQAVLGDPQAATRLSAEAAPEDPLRIGGQLYLRAQSRATQGTAAEDWSLSAPALVDGYFDARPNDRVRGLLLARMSYDPTAPPAPPPGTGGQPPGSGSEGPATLFGFRSARGPHVLLDQLWLRFDVGRAAFVTAGKQHVKWGTARFWTPTDFLHPVRRDPLAVFDARAGATMMKVHVPWEARGWNFYGVALLEGAEPADTLGELAGAARAEVVLGTAEIGLDALIRRDDKPRFGIDVSAGIWELDLHMDVALRHTADFVRWGEVPGADPAGDQAARFRVVGPGPLVDALPDLTAQATFGLGWSRQYADKDVLTLGAEYFFNPAGHADETAYFWTLLRQQQDAKNPPFTPFYLGQHYIGLFAFLPAPGSWDQTTFTLSTLGNLSDRSFLTRLDYGLLVLTHLRFEAFGQVHYGRSGGELRFGLDLPPLTVDGQMIPAIHVPAAAFDLGVALRISL